MESDLHKYCVLVAVEFMKDTMEKHISYINGDDLSEFENIPQLKSGGKIPKVTVEWVDESEIVSTI